jgi:transmembrane sensor
MQHQYRAVEDFLKDESFINYCLKSNEQDVRYWEAFIKANPGKKELVEEAVHEYRLLFSTLANADMEEQLENLKIKMESSDQAPVFVLPPATPRGRSATRRLSKRVIAAMAAAIVLIAAGGYLFFTSRGVATPKPQAIQYACKQGERKSFFFPDGTQVILNAGSEIQLNDQYGKNTREVFLKGEAFFEVQHNKQVPFIVHTASMDVKALGTAFNVKSYNNEKKTETVLIRGLVEVTLKKDNNRKVLLHPEEKVLWTDPPMKHETTVAEPAGKKDTEQGIVQRVNKPDNGNIKELAWVHNNLAFEDEPFEEIALQLNRWYNVNIRFSSNDIKQVHFTATFKKEKIEQVLEILKASKKFNYRIEDGGTIVIYK